MTFTGNDVVDHIIATIIVCIGLISCFCGYRLFRLFLALAGLFITFLFLFTIIYYFITPNLLIASIVSAVIGLAGAFGITYVPALGVFLLGSFFGFSMALVFLGTVRVEYLQQDDVRDVLMLALSIGCGFASLRYKKATVMGGSTFLGAWSIINGVDHWGNTGFSNVMGYILEDETDKIKMTPVFIGLMVAFVVLIILGFLVQFFITGIIDEHDLSVSGQLPITVPGPTCCNPYVSIFRKKTRFSRDEVPLLDVVTLDEY
jgi:hypothetical protein